MMVTELSPTKIDTALKLLARMIARAYLKDARKQSDKTQCLEFKNKSEFTEEQDGDKRCI
jgi:hypothetical protein